MSSDLSGPNRGERLRLAALHEYVVLDAPADDELSAVVRVAATVAGVPTATLNLIDENRQCQLTTVGFEGGDSPRDESMCAVRFLSGRFVHVPDATLDPDYADNPWVTGRLAGVRFYASAPLITPEGYVLGTLCVFDDEPRSLSPGQIERLGDLADVIVALFERRRQARLNAELAIQVEHDRKFIETVLETVDVGVAVADARGHVKVLNRTAREWHGHDAEPAVGPADLADRYELFHAGGTSRLAPHEIPLLRALREDDVSGAEMTIRPADRPPVEVSCHARPLRDDDGTLLGAVVAMTNVTRDRAYRRQLEQAHADLEAAVAELQRSNAELESFAGVVSHDLMRPVAAAHGYLELLGCDYQDALDERGATWLSAATRAVGRMERLVQSLLGYARAGNGSFCRRPVPLAEVLEDVLDDLRPVIEEAPADVAVADGLPTVFAEPTLLHQLMQNLIDNAIKYRHPDRPCRITVTAHRAGDAWTIRVADNGIGIPPGQRGRVFEMFAQVDPAARKGHGIGLSTCQRIVERHSGHIAVLDSPGGGTTICLTFPGGGQERTPADSLRETVHQ